MLAINWLALILTVGVSALPSRCHFVFQQSPAPTATSLAPLQESQRHKEDVSGSRIFPNSLHAYYAVTENQANLTKVTPKRTATKFCLQNYKEFKKFKEKQCPKSASVSLRFPKFLSVKNILKNQNNVLAKVLFKRPFLDMLKTLLCVTIKVPAQGLSRPDSHKRGFFQKDKRIVGNAQTGKKGLILQSQRSNESPRKLNKMSLPLLHLAKNDFNENIEVDKGNFYEDQFTVKCSRFLTHTVQLKSFPFTKVTRAPHLSLQHPGIVSLSLFDDPSLHYARNRDNVLLCEPPTDIVPISTDIIKIDCSETGERDENIDTLALLGILLPKILSSHTLTHTVTEHYPLSEPSNVEKEPQKITSQGSTESFASSTCFTTKTLPSINTNYVTWDVASFLNDILNRPTLVAPVAKFMRLNVSRVNNCTFNNHVLAHFKQMISKVDLTFTLPTSGYSTELLTNDKQRLTTSSEEEPEIKITTRSNVTGCLFSSSYLPTEEMGDINGHPEMTITDTFAGLAAGAFFKEESASPTVTEISSSQNNASLGSNGLITSTDNLDSSSPLTSYILGNANAKCSTRISSSPTRKASTIPLDGSTSTGLCALILSQNKTLNYASFKTEGGNETTEQGESPTFQDSCYLETLDWTIDIHQVKPTRLSSHNYIRINHTGLYDVEMLLENHYKKEIMSEDNEDKSRKVAVIGLMRFQTTKNSCPDFTSIVVTNRNQTSSTTQAIYNEEERIFPEPIDFEAVAKEGILTNDFSVRDEDPEAFSSGNYNVCHSFVLPIISSFSILLKSYERLL